MKEIITEVFVNENTDITLKKIKCKAKELRMPWLVINHLLYDDDGNINVLASEKIIVSFFADCKSGSEYIKEKAENGNFNFGIRSSGGGYHTYIFYEKNLPDCKGYMTLGLVNTICSNFGIL